MPTLEEIKDKDGKIKTIRLVIRYKGVKLKKNYRVKGNQIKTVKNKAKIDGYEIERQIDEGIYRKEPKKKIYSISEALNKYIEEQNPKTVTYLNWFKNEIGYLPIKNIKRSDIKGCREKLQQKHKEIPIKGQKGKGKVTNQPITNSTINRYLAAFSKFLSHCVYEYEILELNPMIGAKLKLKENEPRKRWLQTLDERISLLQLCKETDYHLYLIVLITLTIGARKREILNLTYKDIDFENRAIYLLNTKNGDDRTVPIPDILYDELKSIRQETKIRKIKNDYIFKNTIGGQNDRLISKVFPSIIKKWKYENITFHGLRHTYISIASLLGINQTIIKKIVGHKIDSVTGGYTHTDCQSLRNPMKFVAHYMINGQKENNDNYNYSIYKE